MRYREYSRQFWLMCSSSFLFFISFTMIIPELPAWLSSLGGADYKGWIIALFTISAALARPFSGKLTDTIGRMPVIIIGTLVCVLCGWVYAWIGSVVGFLLLRFCHGFSAGFQPTGTAAFMADVAPVGKRGAAIGFFALVNSIGMSLGPAVGGWIGSVYSTKYVFYTSSIGSMLALLLLIGIKETIKEKQPFSWSLLRLKKNELIETTVWLPALIMFLFIFTHGVILTITPDFCEALGIKNKGLFYTYYTGSSVIVRFLGGNLSDKYGREIVVLISLLATAPALVYIGYATTGTELLIGSALIGLGAGLCGPTIFAWTADKSGEHNRGKAVATVYIALEAGIGMGAYLSGAIYDNQLSRISYPYWLSAGLSSVAALYLIVLMLKNDVFSSLLSKYAK